jgi:hypothetical protein
LGADASEVIDEPLEWSKPWSYHNASKTKNSDMDEDEI